jgi:protein disulfide-isomerase
VPSRVSILETLPKVVISPPKISPKHKNSFFGHLIWTVRSGMSAHPLITLGLVVGLLIGASIWGRGLIRRGKAFGNTGSFFTVGSNGNEKDGLLGGVAPGGKVD